MNKFEKILENQLLAALSTLMQCINNCPDNEWQQTHGDSPYSQVVFHTLFYTDYYLERTEETFKDQPFHLNNKELFKDYEELEDRIPKHLYTKEECHLYLKHCVDKCKTQLPQEDTELLNGPSGFSHKPDINRAEIHIYNTRHIQHHAAQLGLRVQKIINKELQWVSSGWKEII
ncbi:MAG: DinB family protein [Spirochaetes bacterium]|nr:DinB family protein [Spirochaetota bacterium]